MDWGVNEWVAVGSALLAVASLALNWLVVRRQTELQFETLKAQMDAEVFSWAHEAIDLVSQSVALARGRKEVYSPDEFQRLALETEHKLSAVTDRGRLFFPNEAHGSVGKDKEVAFQGI